MRGRMAGLDAVSWAPWAFVALLGAGCAPPSGACSPSTESMDCHGGDAYVCFCDEADDDGECLDDAGTWERDPACSCSGGSMICS